MGRPRAFMVGPLIRMQHFICSVHAMIGGALGGRASALPVGVIVGHVITPLPHGALLSDLSRCLDGAAHHLRWHVLLGIGAGWCRDTVSAKLEWKLVLGAARWSALSSSGSSGRIGVAILVVHILLRGRLGSLLLAGRLGLGWGQLLLLGLPLPRAVRHTVHLPFVPLGGRAVRAIHWPFVILRQGQAEGKLVFCVQGPKTHSCQDGYSRPSPGFCASRRGHGLQGRKESPLQMIF